MAYKPTTRTPQPPPSLPSWMTDFSQQDRSSQPANPSGFDFQLGSADSDQFANSWGVSDRPNEQRSLEGLIANNYMNRPSQQTGQSAFQAQSFYPRDGYVGVGSQGLGMFTAPTQGDRIGRAIGGVFRGYDTGNTAGNIGLQVGAGLVPGGQVANAAAGAIQGYRSDAPDFDKRLPGDKLPENNSGRSTNFQSTDVMPRGIAMGGLLDPSTGPNAESYGAPGPGGPVAPGLRHVGHEGRPSVPGQSAPAQAPTGFTGGSGGMVNPYQLPAQDTLESLLSQAQRYTDYDASTGRTGMAGSGATGGGYQYSGFDFAQDAGNRDVGKSAKYAWAEVTKQLAAQGVPMPRTKEEAGAYAQQAAPLMAQLGFPLSNIVGDKFSVAAREGQDTIDWLIGADSDNPNIGWQSEVLAPGPGMQGGGMRAGAPGLPANGMDLSSSALFDTLMQQARDIAAGKTNGASILDTNALLQLLGK